jgi:hypothetical protein
MIDPLSFFFRDLMLIRKSELDLQAKNPNRFQRILLTMLLVRSSNTRFGKMYNFRKIRSLKSFQKNVPISHYHDLKPYILEMMSGKANVLWPGKIKYFTKSSGTTGENKYIPVSRSALLGCHFQGGKDMVVYYLRSNPDTHLFSGKILSLCGTMYPFPENPRIDVGDISAIMTKNLPLLAQLFRFPSPELALKEDWEGKIEEISEAAIDQNITGLLGAPMWMIVFIKKVLEKSGKQSIHEVWPHLEVVMHGGISFKPYRHIFEELFKGKDIKYIESYNASEGYFAIQDDLEQSNEMRLMVDAGVFYEFIPFDMYEKGIYTDVYTVKDVVLGVNYVIVITTNAGLWRYVIGDTVMFTTLAPLRIKITGRTKQYLNVYDEDITVDNIERAVASASLATGVRVIDFTMCPTLPDGEGKGEHIWVMEFDVAPESMDSFIDALDAALQKENIYYGERRHNDVVLRKPIIRIVPESTFYNWMKSKNRLGGQFKVPRISNSNEHVKAILNSLK